MTNPTNPVNSGVFAPIFTPVGAGSTSYNQNLGWSAQPMVGQAAPVASASPNTYVGLDPADYFEQANHREYFKMMRKQTIQHNLMNRPGPSWTPEDEHKLVNKLFMEWFDEPYESMPDWVHSGKTLDLDKLPLVQVRKRSLPPFKINYQTLAEIKLRLYGTLISIKGNPFFVKSVKQNDGKFYLKVVDGLDREWVVCYDDLHDLRSLPPMYLAYKGTGWLSRHPGRVYQQGINRNNTTMWAVDGSQVLYNIDPARLVKDITKRSDKAWNSTLAELMVDGELHTCRLSDDVAVTRKDEAQTFACYRGRVLGSIEDNTVLLEDEDDLHQEWIDNAVKAVGLNLAA